MGRAVEAALPAGETSWTQSLLWEERRLLSCSPPVAGSGKFHSAFVEAGGQLLTCGKDINGVGVLGQGDGEVESAVPRAVAGLGGVRICTVAVGFLHTQACSDEGVAYSFGYGWFGALGNGDTANQNAPQVIEALRSVHISVVAASDCFSLALCKDGKLYSFGRNWYGQLGHGGRADQRTPRLVAALKGVRVSAMAAGRFHSLVLSDVGEVYSFGRGDVCNYSLILGNDDQQDQLPIRALQGVRVGGVAAGEYHSLVVSTAGTLYSFGQGRWGALGHGDRADQRTPRLVAALQGVRVSAVVAGSHHSLALSEGRVYSFGHSFGSRFKGQVSNCGPTGPLDLTTPRVIAELQGVRFRSVAAGECTSLGVTIDGEVYGWGAGVVEGTGEQDPVLGLGLTEDQYVPLKYPGLRLQ